MKIRLESGELLVVEVPVDFATSALIRVQSTPLQKPGHVPHPLVDVQIEDGLIGKVKEHVVRRNAEVQCTEDRAKLWAHIVSEHASMISPELTLADLIEIHEHEHDGPGTIRNHPRESRTYSLHKIGKVLSEAEPELPLLVTEHDYLASYSSGREVGCHLCRKPRREHAK